MDAARLAAPSNLPLLRPIHRQSPPLHHRLHHSLSIRSTLSSPAAAIAVRESNSSAPALKRVSAESLQYASGFLGAVPERGGGGWGEGEVSAMEYLTNILAPRVYEVAVETPLDDAGKLSERFRVKVWLKKEDLQPVFSFKVRGAYNMMAKLPRSS